MNSKGSYHWLLDVQPVNKTNLRYLKDKIAAFMNANNCLEFRVDYEENQIPSQSCIFLNTPLRFVS